MTYPNLVYPATPFPTDSVPTLSADLAESGVSSFTTTPPPAWWAELDASGNPLNVPLGQSGPFLVQIDEEQILCSSVSETGVLAIVVQEGPERGYNETTPAFHEATSKVYLLATSAQNAGAGGISTITSTDGSVTVTDPTGPSTDLSVVKVNGISYFIGSGSPVGVVTPNAAGDQYIDNTPGPSWQATGTLDTDWQQVGVPDETYATIAAAISTVPTPGTIGVQSFDLPFTADQSVGNYSAGGYTSVPQVASALGQVCESFGCSIFGIDTTSDLYGIRMLVIISDLTGTNILTINGTAQASAGGPNDSASVDWTTATATAVAGTDLVWDDTTTTVTSTAGGVYVVSVYLAFGWE